MRKLVIYILFATTAGLAAPAGAPPQFDEVYQLLRSNLDGVTSNNLNRDAVKGLLGQLSGQVTLVAPSTNGTALNNGELLAKTTNYDQAYAYMRVGTVESGLAQKIFATWRDLGGKAKLKGVILDLRFAGGTDYAAAAAAADCFLDSTQALLNWGAGSASATRKTNAINVPLAILVNSQTTGAAEAMAAVLRDADTGLILGGTTAGQADIFKEFSLSNGDKLRIATAPVKLGDGTALSHGVKPDIIVSADLADERAYLADPYKVLHPAPVPEKGIDQSTNEQRHPANEAELVREHRDGISNDESDDEMSDQLAVPEPPSRPVIEDATLARALDLLKGLAVIQQSHPG